MFSQWLKRKNWVILIVVGILMTAGGVLLFAEVTVLHLQNMDHPQEVFLRMTPGEKFLLFYIDSTHKESVVEEFQAEKKMIVFKGLKTKSRAIMEYYGFEDFKEFRPMDQKLGAVFIIRRSMGEGQGLIVKDRKIYFSSVGTEGDRLLLRVESLPLGTYLLSTLFQEGLG